MQSAAAPHQLPGHGVKSWNVLFSTSSSALAGLFRQVFVCVSVCVGPMDALHRHRSLYKGTTPPWKETYRRVRDVASVSRAGSRGPGRTSSLCCSVCLSPVALRGPAEEQPLEAAGEVPADGGEPAARRRRRPRGLHHRAGGDGGGVERAAVRGPEAALPVGAGGHGGGRPLSLCLSLSVLASCDT